METALLYTLGVVSFVLAILISIGLHELGHMIPAKRFGAKVTQYFIGFGPTVWSKHRGETEYGVKAIPLGGFVRIIGMMPPEKGHFESLKKEASPDENDSGEAKIRLRETNTGMFTGLISTAKSAEYETISAEDEHRLFYRLTWWRKLIVMASGPSVNLVLAFLCFLGVFALHGQEEIAPLSGAPIVSTVAECAVPPYGEETPTCAEKDKSPAWQAGLRPGDKITGLNGDRVDSWAQLTDTIRLLGPSTITLTVERGDEVLTLKTTTVKLLRPDSEVNGKTVSVAFLGVAPVVEAVTVRHGPIYTLGFMKDKTVETFQAFAQIPAKVKNVTLAIVGVEDRDPNGPVSIVGGARFSGEVAAYENGDVDGFEISFGDKIVAFFMLVGGFNLFIGLFNFLPILPLDGGHMAGALYEGIKRGFAKLFNRPMPAPVDIARMLPVAYAFGMALFLLGAILIVGDLVVPIKLFG